jgi:hypothetical protein
MPLWPPASADAGLRASFGPQRHLADGSHRATLGLPAVPGEWHDPMDDTFGMSGIDNTTTMGGEIVLSQLIRHADIWYRVWAMVEGDDGKIYLGTTEGRLKVYDPSTGTMEDRGKPVPDEPYT